MPIPDDKRTIDEDLDEDLDEAASDAESTSPFPSDLTIPLEVSEADAADQAREEPFDEGYPPS